MRNYHSTLINSFSMVAFLDLPPGIDFQRKDARKKYEGVVHRGVKKDKSISSHPRIVIEDLPPGWFLDIPSDAILEDVTITCKVHSSNESLLSPYDKLASEIVEMGPTGLNFAKPVSLKIPLKGKPRPGQHTIIMTSQDGIKWTQLSKNMQTDGYYRISIEHFTFFSVIFGFLRNIWSHEEPNDEFLTFSDDQNVRLLIPKVAIPPNVTITMHVIKIPPEAGLLHYKAFHIGDIIHLQNTANLQMLSKAMNLTLPLPNCPDINRNKIRIFKNSDNHDWADITNIANFTISQKNNNNYISLDIHNFGSFVTVVENIKLFGIGVVLQEFTNGICYTPANVFLLRGNDNWKQLLVACVSQDACTKHIHDLKSIYSYIDPPSPTYLHEGQRVHYKLLINNLFEPLPLEPIIFYENLSHYGLHHRTINLKLKDNVEENDIFEYLEVYSPEEDEIVPKKCIFRHPLLFTNKQLPVLPPAGNLTNDRPSSPPHQTQANSNSTYFYKENLRGKRKRKSDNTKSHQSKIFKKLCTTSSNHPLGGTGTKSSMASSSSASSKRLDEVLLRGLSFKLGSEWKTVGTQLGLKSPEIQDCQSNHPHQVKDQIFEMLTVWNNRNSGEGSKLEQLTAALGQAGRDDIIDWLDEQSIPD